MTLELLTPAEAAHRLGVSVTTLYDWLGRSRRNLLEIHGQLVTIEFFQTGAKAQGRIRIPAVEIERLQELMRVKPRSAPTRRPPIRRESYPFITVPLGYPR